MGEPPRRSVEDVHLIVVATRYPKLLSIRGHVAHVGTATSRNRPIGDDFVSRGIEHADRARSATTTSNRIPAAIRHVQFGPISARINPVGADARMNEANALELIGIDYEDAILFHVGHVELAAIR